MERKEIRKIIGEKNAKNIPLTEQEKKIALQYYTEEQIKCIQHFKLECSLNSKQHL
jgi:hypothetical protein